LVVAHVPWQKVDERPITAAEDRFAMVQALAAGIDGVAASRIEIDRGGESYTADTITQLRSEDPARELFVVLGADAAGGLPTWKRAEEVRTGSTLVLVDRPGLATAPPPAGWSFERVVMPRLDI